MESNLKVIYMISGMFIIGEIARIPNHPTGGMSIKRALALMPTKDGMQLMEAFPFTDLDEEITLEHGSYTAITKIDDHGDQILKKYENGIRQVREQKSGLILP